MPQLLNLGLNNRNNNELIKRYKTFSVQFAKSANLTNLFHCSIQNIHHKVHTVRISKHLCKNSTNKLQKVVFDRYLLN